MNSCRKRPLAFAALGAIVLTLAGCEAAEQSAQKLADEAKKEAQALIEGSVGEVVDEVNRQVDALQDSTNRALGKAEEEGRDGSHDEPSAERPVEPGVET